MVEAEIRTDPSVTTSDDDFIGPDDLTSFHNVTEKDGDGLTVAIMDSGIDTSHDIWKWAGVDIEQPDIDGLPTNGTDRVGHGTGCAGVSVLMAPNVETVVDVPIFGSEGRTGFGTIESAYEWLIENADRLDMVNMSWGSSSKYQPIDTLHNELEQAGVDAVVAAGNTDQQTGSPATAERAFAVAACTQAKKMTRWSSPTDNVTTLGKNVAMPKSKNGHMGRKISPSAYTETMEEIGGTWIKASGTSFSCPAALGMGATIQSNEMMSAAGQPDVDTHFEEAFHETANDIKGTSEDGVGYIDFEAATKVGSGEQVAEATVWSMPWGDEDFLHVNADVLEDGEYVVDLEALLDALNKK